MTLRQWLSIFLVSLWLTILFKPGGTLASGVTAAIIPQAVPTANKEGNGTKFMLFTGADPATNDCAKFDVNHNLVTNGSGCGGGGQGQAGATLFSATASTTVTAASATTLIGTVTGSTTIAANTFTAGGVMEVLAEGFYTTPATARTLNISLLIGGSSRVSTGAVTVLALITNGTWRLHCGVTTRTAGVSGTQIANCIFEMAPSSLSVLTPGEASMQASAAWTVNTTGTLALDLQAAWDATTGSPSITATNVAAWIPGAPVTSVFGQTGAVDIPVTTTDIATPANPGAGTTKFYTKAGTLCSLAPAGTETCTGGGGGGTTVTVAIPTITVSGTPYGPVWSLVAPPTTGWSTDNLGTGSFDTTAGYPYVVWPNAGGADQLRVLYRNVPATPYTVCETFTHDISGIPPGTTQGIHVAYGIAWRDGTGKIIRFGMSADGQVVTQKWTTSTGGISDYKSTVVPGAVTNSEFLGRNPQVMCERDDGTTNLTWYWSIDFGGHLKQYDQRARTDFFGSGPTQIGISAYVSGADVNMALIGYKVCTEPATTTCL
jgi:hypothetical protein